MGDGGSRQPTREVPAGRVVHGRSDHEQVGDDHRDHRDLLEPRPTSSVARPHLVPRPSTMPVSRGTRRRVAPRARATSRPPGPATRAMPSSPVACAAASRNSTRPATPNHADRGEHVRDRARRGGSGDRGGAGRAAEIRRWRARERWARAGGAGVVVVMRPWSAHPPGVSSSATWASPVPQVRYAARGVRYGGRRAPRRQLR